MSWDQNHDMSYTKTYLDGYLIQSFYLSDKESDITLVVNGHRLKAHKFVLSSKSIVFKRMFFGHFMEAMAKESVLQDTNTEAFKLLLKYCYFEDLSAEDFGSNGHQLVIDVFKLSHRYQMKFLSIRCQLKLIGQISVFNVIDILKFGLFYRLKRIIVFIRIFAKNEKQVLIVSKDLLECDDQNVVKCLIKWMSFEDQMLPIKTLLAIAHKNGWNAFEFIDCLRVDKITTEDLNYLRNNDSILFQEIVMKKVLALEKIVAELKTEISSHVAKPLTDLLSRSSVANDWESESITESIDSNNWGDLWGEWN